VLLACPVHTARHVVFVQHGDFAEAEKRFASGGLETYAAQRYSVDLVGSLAAQTEVTVISLPAPRSDQVLASGVRAIGLGWAGRRRSIELLRLLERLKPTELVLRTPLVPALVWALARRRRVLPLLADSFGASKGRLSTRLLATVLNAPGIDIVGNHNVFASRSLVDVGVSASKVVPWNWPPSRHPNELVPRRGTELSPPFRVFYAGVITADKGVTDLIHAAGLLVQRGLDLELRLAGAGAVAEMQEFGNRLGLAGRMQLLGRIPNTDVFDEMRRAHAIVVPSRPNYPEGLPMVITEALCSRTPLLVSDHPIFLRAFPEGVGVRTFAAANPEALARAIAAVTESPALFEELSERSLQAWEQTQVPVSWGELLQSWLAATPEDLAYLRSHALVNA
jgi:glycosyltransferase involved in cell wall biosynthesis